MFSDAFALLLGAVILSPALTAAPLLSLRLRANETASAETWRANFKAIAEHPGEDKGQQLTDTLALIH